MKATLYDKNILHLDHADIDKWFFFSKITCKLHLLKKEKEGFTEKNKEEKDAMTSEKG